VCAKNVSFAYPARPDVNVLEDVNLDIPAGSRVAVLGRSGCGKSTLAALLAGLYMPNKGRVIVDGVDIWSQPGGTAWVRSQLGVISQEPTLFALSVRDNVAYGLDAETGATGMMVEMAAETARVTEFTTQLPLGLETEAGERGQALSGGQKQRVCIARALARQPRILIFDEATSALDLHSERLVQAALADVLAGGKVTCLVITHRLSALQWVDRIAVVSEQGCLVQEGLKDEVMGRPCAALQAILHGGAAGTKL